MTLQLNEITPEVLDAMEAMSIWKPSDGKHVKLYNWRAYRVEGLPDKDPTVHFVGDSGREGRVTSAVMSYSDRKGTTRSRVYELYGPSGHGIASDPAYVWSSWLKMNKNPKFIEITELYE